MQTLFNSVFSSTESSVSVWLFLLCVGVSLVLGLSFAAAYAVKNKPSSSFLLAIAALPSVVCVVIMAVNGNVGVGVAVAGAFSLVRFRSAQGSAKEICVIFMAMGAGLLAGVGYLGYAALFNIICCLILIAGGFLANSREKKPRNKTLKITIPEDLDYDGVFDKPFGEYLDENSLASVKTVNMGTMFRLTYAVRFKKGVSEKKFIDEMRVRNGNLEILLSKESDKNDL